MTDRLPQYLDIVEVAGMAGQGRVLDVDLTGDEPRFCVLLFLRGYVKCRGEDVTIVTPAPASNPEAYR